MYRTTDTGDGEIYSILPYFYQYLYIDKKNFITVAM